MNRILITGGAGFIGSHFVRHVLGSTARPVDRLVVLDALTYAGVRTNVPDDPRVVFVHGDILDADLVSGLLRVHGIGRLVHFAAESHVDRSIDTPEPFVQTNVVGTLRLLDVFRRHWKAAPEAARAAMRFLHISTDEVFGSLGLEDPAFSETTPYAPNSPYAASKAGSDHLVRAAHHTYGLPVLLTNCSNNYGPRQFPEKLIPLMILNALEGKPLPIYGDGANIRDWLYVEDHCTAIARVLEAGVPGESYNIGGASERTNLVLIDALIRLLDELAPRAGGGSYAVLKSFVPDRPGHDRRYAMDIRKIQRELGWSPRWTLETGLRETVQWYLQNRQWCDNITAKKYARERLGSRN
ncbi:MAG: dTDP-glucose 4,6-dehydratase [Candidatus Methylacidiphilales bacterium]|nr:dTDP-glucose 4,6-dehydratase [Candidatus Methylacidiphilales bacterium]